MYVESDLEQTVIEWLQNFGYSYALGADLSPGGVAPERDSYSQVVLYDRLFGPLQNVNPTVHDNALDETMRLILLPQNRDLIRNSHDFHKYITNAIYAQATIEAV